jgi:hypothetical protein
VLRVDDLSRLSRDSVEVQQQVRRLRFHGVRVIAISDSIDTDDKSHKLGVGIRGLMGEIYLADLADKTHRGLTGRALAGASAGGLPYGYRVAEVGQRVIDAAQAVVVRRIYADYLAGSSARAIAAALNAECVPSARDSTWCASAIHGDTRRGIGILANPIYAGRQVWNRSRWIKHPDSGRRVRQERPESEWILAEHPELAIVDAATWDAVQRRLRGSSHASPVVMRGPGRPPRHLLSGILRCGDCGGPMVVVDRYRYGCAIAKERGTCLSRLRVARTCVEDALLAGIKRELLSEESFQRFQRAAAAELKRATPSMDTVKSRLVDAERVHANMMAALRAGIITPGTRAALIEAEREVEAARAAVNTLRLNQPSQILPRARETWRRIVSQLADVRDLPEARDALRELLGSGIVLKASNGAVVAEISESQICMVAGAGSVRYLTGPLRIPIEPRPGRKA